ncbi:MAG: hypothetical protein EOP11_26880, partial [Proteobacteria bacterium]
RPPYGLAKLAKKSIGMGLFLKEELLGYTFILPGPSTYEKAGSFVNHQGKRQNFQASIPPVGMSRPLKMALSAVLEPAKNKEVARAHI